MRIERKRHREKKRRGRVERSWNGRHTTQNRGSVLPSIWPCIHTIHPFISLYSISPSLSIAYWASLIHTLHYFQSLSTLLFITTLSLIHRWKMTGRRNRETFSRDRMSVVVDWMSHQQKREESASREDFLQLSIHLGRDQSPPDFSLTNTEGENSMRRGHKKPSTVHCT